MCSNKTQNYSYITDIILSPSLHSWRNGRCRTRSRSRRRRCRGFGRNCVLVLLFQPSAGGAQRCHIPENRVSKRRVLNECLRSAHTISQSPYLHDANAGKINVRKRWGIIRTALKLQCVRTGGCRKHAKRDGHGEYRMKFI